MTIQSPPDVGQDGKVSNKDVTLRNARESRLLRLPPELRSMIYSYAIGDQQIGLEVGRGHESPSRHNPRNPGWHAWSKPISADSNTPSYLMRPLLPLLLSCRQIHADAALLPFSLNQITFDFLDPFLRLMRRLTDRQRNAIRTIRAISEFASLLLKPESYYYEHLFADDGTFPPLATLAGLECIVVEIDTYGGKPWFWETEEFYEEGITRIMGHGRTKVCFREVPDLNWGRPLDEVNAWSGDERERAVYEEALRGEW